MNRALPIAVTLVAVIAAMFVQGASARGFTAKTLTDHHVGTTKSELIAQKAYSASVIAAINRHGRWRYAPRHKSCWSHVAWSTLCNHVRGRLLAHRWLYRVATRRLAAIEPPASSCGASGAACAWYADGATQCETSHEGGFTSVSPDGTYHGRFQMDYSFETSTPYGRTMEARYGRASSWPSGAQIQHAYEVWLVRGWGPWPPYYAYGCASYHGGTYL